MEAVASRSDQLRKLFEEEKIDVQRLQTFCFEGIPDENEFRSKCWRVLLGYLPTERSRWESTLTKQRSLYRTWVEEMIIYPGEQDVQGDGQRLDITSIDHPLNVNPQSTWSTYFKDNEVLAQIDKDARRLYPDISFFQSATVYPFRMPHKDITAAEYLRKRIDRSLLKKYDLVKNRSGGWNITGTSRKRTEYENLTPTEEAHWEVVERILFMYAKLNPGQGYVQGMNEIVGPIYYAFCHDKDQKFRKHAEVDTFFCFSNLMGEIRDRFIKHLDDSSSGIVNSMSVLISQLKALDTVLSTRLEELDIKPQYYSFRWLTLLLSQEFTLPDVLRLWDSMFADPDRFDFLFDICCAMIILIRDQLLEGDFATSMKLLQNYPVSDIRRILTKAEQIRLQRCMKK